MREGHLEVPRTARYWVLGEEGAPELWYALHGYRQLARRFANRFAPIAGPKREIVVPEGLNRFYIESAKPRRHGPESVVGATWMTREERLDEIRDYVRYLDLLHAEVGGRRGGGAVTVVGFSQGVATAARWIALGALRPARLICWGETLPPDLDMARAADAYRGMELLLVRGDADPAIDEGRAAEERAHLDAAGIECRVVSYEGGHDIDQPTLQEIAESGSPSAT